MSKQRSKKQLKKQKDRERNVRKNRKDLSAKREAKALDRQIRKVAPLPEFRIDDSESTENIAELVSAGVDGLGRVYPQILDEDILALMVGHQKNGWTDLVNEHAAHVKDMTRGEVERGMTHFFEKAFGDGILRYAPPNLLRRYLPSSCFTLRPGERHWDIRCRSLRQVKTDDGYLYQSPHEPAVEWAGETKRVAFTRHALTQLADRILPSWRAHYIGQAYVFGFLYECVYFEVIQLQSGQPALVVYNSCLRAGSHLREYMRGLLKLKSDKEMVKHYYKVGYLPLTFEADMAVAKTFLTPGYWHTPERKTVFASKGAKVTIRDIEQACDDGINIMSVSTCERTKAAVRWFHTHGAPQAKKIEQEVFRDMAGPYSFLGAIIDELPTEPS